MIASVVLGAATLPGWTLAVARCQCGNGRRCQTPDAGDAATASIADEGGKNGTRRRLCSDQSLMPAQLDLQLQRVKQRVGLGCVVGPYDQPRVQNQSCE